MDQRLFVRHYTHAVPRIASALWREEAVDLEQPQPTSILLYREHAGQALRTFYPTPMGLGVVIERTTGRWPEALAALADQAQARRDAERRLIEAGVLPRR